MKSLSRIPLGLTCLAVLSACAGRTSISVAPIAVPGIRVVTPANAQEQTFDALIARATSADVVFLGEQHDDAETHRVEFGLLDAIGRSGRPVVLSLEMFERDVQGPLNDYLAGKITETDFLARSRPWERYVSDYRAMVELAKARGWPVVAANVPRSLASSIGRKGLAAFDTLTAEQRTQAAKDIDCPDDDYKKRFMEEMRGHGAGSPQPSDSLPTAVAQRFYLSQCVKDETMAESIVDALRKAGPRAIVVHYNGSFHSDYAQGTAQRVRRREPGRTMLVISAVPVADPSSASVATYANRGDFVIFTKRPLEPPRPAR